MKPTRRALEALYRRLFEHYGAQNWWPAESPFEVMVGAVLTQNTAWSNVEKAIGNLKLAGLLDPSAMVRLVPERLALHLRPSGYFNLKARRLHALCGWLLENGEAWRAMPTGVLRQSLLAIHGIGPETADDILLYAYQRPVFVIDAYTRRLVSRLGLLDGELPYEALRSTFERLLPADVALFNEYHALIDQHAKQVCRPKPRCEACFLQRACAWSKRAEQSEKKAR